MCKTTIFASVLKEDAEESKEAEEARKILAD